jgi:hypothetical protein
VDLDGGTAQVDFDAGKATSDQYLSAVAAVGYRAETAPDA